jgi:FSR family fosmidomycin resistance protein-like MFS transporter
MQAATATEAAPPQESTHQTALRVLWALSLAHLLNDLIQSLLPAVYPLLKEAHGLTFAQIGFITFTFQVIAAALQPVVGMYTDRRPKPYSLPAGMAITLVGVILLSRAERYETILAAAAMIGVGSSIFHPEASRMAHLAAGKKHGFAQSLFQVGGNFGGSLGPLFAAAVIVPFGQGSIAWFSLAALLGIAVLVRVGAWYHEKLRTRLAHGAPAHVVAGPKRPSRHIIAAVAILVALVTSKYFYVVSFTNFYTFYLIDRFRVSIPAAQTYLFMFLAAIAAGTFAGGPLGDHFGRKIIIWISILGVAPFALLLPHANLPWTIALSMAAGAIIASAFSAILVYAQELIPGRVGTIAGLFFGFAFGISGVAASALGHLADHTSIRFVFNLCAYLPLIGLLAAFLPNIERR